MRFLLASQDADAMATRAVASLGLLPQVAWAQLTDHHQPGQGRCAVSLGTSAGSGSATSITRVSPRVLAVQLELPLELEVVHEMRLLLSLVHSIHERLSEIEALRSDARTDALTGLWNRRGFLPFLDQAIARTVRGHGVALMLCDIDHFKIINDSLGHGAGDVALQGVADCLRSIVRPSDLVARLGGDELVVLLSDTDAAGAERVAQRVREALACSNLLESRTITLSIGIADVRALPPSISAEAKRELLLRTADEALYAAKAAGRNCSIIHDRCRGATPPPALATRRRTTRTRASSRMQRA